MQKTRAIIGTIVTIIIGMIGLSGYSSGSHIMTWFGIKLSQGAFYGLLLVFIAIDVFALKKAFGAKAEIQALQSTAQQKTEALPRMEGTCTVSITRLSSMLGAAMGVKVYLNGVEQGVLKNGKTLTFSTQHAQNELSVYYNADGTQRSIAFDAQPGGHVRITLKYTGGVLNVTEAA